MKINNTSNNHRNQPLQLRHCAAYARAFQLLNEKLVQNSSRNAFRRIDMARLRLFGCLPEEKNYPT
jgi:hypothetical protein